MLEPNARQNARETLCGKRRGERGFSLVEVLIASLIMLVVALGIVSLFTMAAASNLQGNDNTKAANFAREKLETLWQIPFDDVQLEITGGATTNVTYDYYNDATRVWTPMASASPPVGAMWWRTTTIRQFGVDDLATPVSGDTATADPTQVQLKEITVEVHNKRVGGVLGGGKELTLVGFRSA